MLRTTGGESELMGREATLRAAESRTSRMDALASERKRRDCAMSGERWREEAEGFAAWRGPEGAAAASLFGAVALSVEREVGHPTSGSRR